MNKSTHILNTSSNLLGLCFLVLTSLTVLHFRQSSLIDEFTAVATISFMVSCILSFLSIRTNNEKIASRYEGIADFFFLMGLSVMFLTTMVITFDVIH